MKTKEIAFAFNCQDAELIGIVHLPEVPAKRGVLAVVAGGPQYRAGCCRQLVYMARSLAEEGIPVMRFDYRGMGDAGGKFSGFQNVEDDLRAALDVFIKTVPGLNEIVLWGGCDAGSAVLINAWKYPIVSGIVLASPFVRAEQTHIAAVRHHYWKRIREKSFWIKLFQFRFNLAKTAQSFFHDLVLSRIKSRFKPSASKLEKDNRPFQELMLEGLEKFNGRVLLVMSGRSIEALEFDEVVAESERWRKAIDQTQLTRTDLADADQAFSSLESRNGLVDAGRGWLCAWPESPIN